MPEPRVPTAIREWLEEVLSEGPATRNAQKWPVIPCPRALAVACGGDGNTEARTAHETCRQFVLPILSRKRCNRTHRVPW